ncbi:LPS translocon maturation chaperone LptM [Stenotrophomonas maltophilia]|uniref:LPS translocon maturation chaperone LptM n=1 Tax=Stenotrophomonas maltophilia TaxID=40324 RepID=UPI000C158892|nr:lipoprotein [Stenotrophomonas maltophilia]EKT4096273.1 lipoprotein [Stenotrophomonas maltophilia]EKT4099655.1 lipoprotein [Stenotrophomonas maltophilia]MBA0302262.1 sugar transporter [Stenotrophomonas maltophilia]MBN5075408.1 lipoprotein [Stenotrophomonas maltophilia]QGL69248.1 sugar transporter [Stenotrophomonas maltophilia]
MKIPHRNAILIPLAAASLLFLAACGNKGPLVLPQKPVPVEETVEPVAEPATEATPAQTEGSSTPATTVEPAAPTTQPAPAPAKKVGGGNE